jgi:hypothetical protein
LTLALPFLPVIGQWFEFVYLPASYFAFLLVVDVAFLVMTELLTRVYVRLWQADAPVGDCRGSFRG